MYIDTHCHIDENIVDEYVENAKSAGVYKIVSASEDLSSSINNVFLASKYAEVFTCVGVHPENVDNFNFDEMNSFLELGRKEKVKAIGEIGLDYYYTKDNKDAQIKVFREFLSLAEKLNLPVVIHSREATMDTINILKEYKVSGVIHCFSGSLETAREYIKMGFLLGVGGVLTFKNSRLFEVIKEIPTEYIVLETDAPFLTPEPFRKYKNESKYIPVIAEKLSEIKGISLEKVSEITTENARRIFDI